MKFCSNDLCILSGKGPGAAQALETAAKGGTDATVGACLLFAPAPPAPERCGYEGPVMWLGSRGESSAIYRGGSSLGDRKMMYTSGNETWIAWKSPHIATSTETSSAEKLYRRFSSHVWLRVYTPKLPFEWEYDDTIRDAVGALFADNPRP